MVFLPEHQLLLLAVSVLREAQSWGLQRGKRKAMFLLMFYLHKGNSFSPIILTKAYLVGLLQKSAPFWGRPSLSSATVMLCKGAF